MPDYQFTFTVHDITSQKATAIRDRLNARFEEDAVSVVSSTMGQMTQNYRVLGVDCSTKEPFDQTVEAKDKQDAEAQVIGSSTTKVAVAIRETSP